MKKAQGTSKEILISFWLRLVGLWISPEILDQNEFEIFFLETLLEVRRQKLPYGLRESYRIFQSRQSLPLPGCYTK